MRLFAPQRRSNRLSEGSNASLVNPFCLDTRSLALFRILVAVVVIIDCAVRLSLVEVFLGSTGLPNPTDQTLFPDWLWSVHRLHGSSAYAAGLLMLQIGVAMLVLVGWRTQQVFIALTLLTLSLHNANPYILDGGDRSLMVMMTWACFLPLGQSWSLDAGRLPYATSSQINSVYSLASITFTLQICLIYWVTVSHKSVDHWLIQRDAVWYALNLDHFTTRFGAWAAKFQIFTALSSITTYAIQVLAPMALLLPIRIWQVRLGALAVLATMHLGFIPFLELGLFPWINLTGLVALIPGQLWSELPYFSHSEKGADQGIPPQHPPFRYPLVERIRRPLLILLITLALVTGISDRSRPGGLAPELEPIKALGIHQHWKMFSPLPNPIDFWFELVDNPNTPAATRRVLPGLEAFAEDGNPRRKGHRLHTQRWRKYIDNLNAHRAQASLVQSYLQHLCRQLPAGSDHQLERIEEPTDPLGGSPGKLRRISVARFHCSAP